MSNDYSPVQAYEEAGQILSDLQGKPEQELPPLTIGMVEEISACLREASRTINDQHNIDAGYRGWVVQHLSLASKYLYQRVKGER